MRAATIAGLAVTLPLLLACAVPASTPSPSPAATPPLPTPLPTVTPIASPSPSLSPLPTATPAATPVPTPSPTPAALPTVQADIGGHIFTLEVAESSTDRARGLMDRSSLPRDAGMLFIFQREVTLTFWMKDTLIPLDILYLDGQRRIVDIQTMQPEPDVPSNLLTRYPSAQPAQYAIEINGGLAAELGITADTRVQWE